MSFPNWESLKQGFVGGFEVVYRRALAQADSFAAERREEAARLVAAFLGALTVTEGTLAPLPQLLAALPDDAATRALRTRYDEIRLLHGHLLAAFRRETVVSQEGPPEGVVETGAVPVVLAFAVEGAIWIGVTAAGVALAMAAWDYAKGTQQHAEALLVETNGRVEAMRTGQALPGSELATAPPNPPDDGKKGGWGWLLLLAGAAAGAAFLVPKLAKG